MRPEDQRELWALALLEALVRGVEAPVQAAEERLPALSSARLGSIRSRLGFLIRRLGFQDVDPSRLVSAWADQVATKPKTSRIELLETARRISRSMEDDEGVLGRWKRDLLARLEPILTRSDGDRIFSGLDFDPLLVTWPQRLLEHHRWAYAEAPLPEMRPLPLDDVWVELRFAEPSDGRRLDRGRRLAEALDQRYEERQWRSLQLEFMIERFDGSAVLVGAPGSGKTTLLKWIARWLIRHPGGRFVLPLFVPLRSYGSWRSEHPDGGFLDFALTEAGIEDPTQRHLWSNALSYLAGPAQDHVLLLLDGWDEVRREDREVVRQDIEHYAHGFALLLTSRPSGHPRTLPIYDLFEIMELSPEGMRLLLHQWFEGVGAPELSASLEGQLERSPDLKRMARNPFLLSLLCGLVWQGDEEAPQALPGSRTVLYERAIALVLGHHGRRYPGRGFGPRDQRAVERLAYWLLAEAPGAPRYVFGAEDAIPFGHHPEWFENYLMPSRLLGQLELAEDTHHFLHTTFQEYLAACALARSSIDEMLQSIRRHAYDVSWLEVLQFLAGQSGAARFAFWQEMRRVAEAPDRFGHVYLRLARFATEAGLAEGGVGELGIDLRDKLWEGVGASSFSGRFFEALATLDRRYLLDRVGEALASGDEVTQKRIYRNLGRVAEAGTSGPLLDRVLAGSPSEFTGLLAELRRFGRLDYETLNRLRMVAFGHEGDLAERKNALSALGELRDGASIPQLLEMARGEPRLAQSAVFTLGWIGGERATEALVSMVDWHAELEWQKDVLATLGLAGTPAARDYLLERLALLDLDNALLVPVLQGLHGFPLHHGADLIAALLQPDLPAAVRAAAAHALQEATGSGIVTLLARAGNEDPEAEVRLAALQSLEGRGSPHDLGWLKLRVEDSDRSEEERALALRALLTTVHRFARSPKNLELRAQGTAAVLRSLQDLKMGELTSCALELAHLAGEFAAPRLAEVALDTSLDTKLRCLACASLGLLDAKDSVDSLAYLVSLSSNAEVRDRGVSAANPWVKNSTWHWERTEDGWSLPPQRVHIEFHEDLVGQAAADALAWIDPSRLLEMHLTVADNALAAWAMETGSLVFPQHVLGAGGEVSVRSTSSAPAGGAERAMVPTLVPDLEVTIVSSGESRPVFSFRVRARDPIFFLGEDDFGPVQLGQDPESYRSDLIQDIAGFSTESEEWQAISADRLRSKGLRLFALLPLGLQTWLWLLRHRVKSVRLLSEELYLPWELLRLASQGAEAEDLGCFASEVFALTRWRKGVKDQLGFELSQLAVVASEAGSDIEVREELSDLVRLFGPERLTVIPSRHQEVRRALASGSYDGWHFIGHATAQGSDVDLWEILLDDGQSLRPEDLRGMTGFGLRRPLVFLNGCATGLVGRGLEGPGGWAWQCLESGAGAFLGTHWAVDPRQARDFALEFYRVFLQGQVPLGEAARLARLELRARYPGSPTWLAYVVYGHPLARCTNPHEAPPDMNLLRGS